MATKAMALVEKDVEMDGLTEFNGTRNNAREVRAYLHELCKIPKRLWGQTSLLKAFKEAQVPGDELMAKALYEHENTMRTLLGPLCFPDMTLTEWDKRKGELLLGGRLPDPTLIQFFRPSERRYEQYRNEFYQEPRPVWAWLRSFGEWARGDVMVAARKHMGGLDVPCTLSAFSICAYQVIRDYRWPDLSLDHRRRREWINMAGMEPAGIDLSTLGDRIGRDEAEEMVREMLPAYYEARNMELVGPLTLEGWIAGFNVRLHKPFDRGANEWSAFFGADEWSRRQTQVLSREAFLALLRDSASRVLAKALRNFATARALAEIDSDARQWRTRDPLDLVMPILVVEAVGDHMPEEKHSPDGQLSLRERADNLVAAWENIDPILLQWGFNNKTYLNREDVAVPEEFLEDDFAGMPILDRARIAWQSYRNHMDTPVNQRAADFAEVAERLRDWVRRFQLMRNLWTVDAALPPRYQQMRDLMARIRDAAADVSVDARNYLKLVVRDPPVAAVSVGMLPACYIIRDDEEDEKKKMLRTHPIEGVRDYLGLNWIVENYMRDALRQMDQATILVDDEWMDEPRYRDMMVSFEMLEEALSSYDAAMNIWLARREDARTDMMLDNLLIDLQRREKVRIDELRLETEQRRRLAIRQWKTAIRECFLSNKQVKLLPDGLSWRYFAPVTDLEILGTTSRTRSPGSTYDIYLEMGGAPGAEVILVKSRPVPSVVAEARMGGRMEKGVLERNVPRPTLAERTNEWSQLHRACLSFKDPEASVTQWALELATAERYGIEVVFQQ